MKGHDFLIEKSKQVKKYIYLGENYIQFVFKVVERTISHSFEQFDQQFYYYFQDL